MATIQTALSSGQLILSHPEHGSLQVPLVSKDDLTVVPVQVWDDHCHGLSEGPVVSEWLTRVLGLYKGSPIRMVRFSDTSENRTSREVGPKYTHTGETMPYTHFADAFPMLVASRESLVALNDALREKGETQVLMDRFRPNIVFDECGGAFRELYDCSMTCDKYTVAVRKPCERCPIVRVDQQTGEFTSLREPLPTLIALNPFRADWERLSAAEKERCPRTMRQKAPYFGGNALLIRGGGEVAVGDELVLTE
ncbi:hypothetical protein KIPB_006722 [Kipferlia bialata]|uniref:MOSC domain-containing protein n=1 Tax=Kipferlia bialata TaxID=797122 RepID=A0A9K3D0N2_9EUKA|nr:hypothetical protein KIPB_006722 [Kipferlia bialata]|eukprot:g6722.t1